MDGSEIKEHQKNYDKVLHTEYGHSKVKTTQSTDSRKKGLGDVIKGLNLFAVATLTGVKNLDEGLFDFMQRMRDIHNFIGVGTGRGSSFPNYDWDVSEDVEDERILHTCHVDVSTMTNTHFEKSKIRMRAVWRKCCIRFVRRTFMFDFLTPLGCLVRVEEDTDTDIHDNRSSTWRISRLRKSRRARQCLVQRGLDDRGMWHADQTWHGACLETRRQDESALPAVVSKLVIIVFPLMQIVHLEKLTSVSYAELLLANAGLVDQFVVCIWAVDVVSDRRAATLRRGLLPFKLFLFAKWCGKKWQQYRKLNPMRYVWTEHIDTRC